MNWFQNFVSLWSETVRFGHTTSLPVLWIGFKILYLCDLKQWELKKINYNKVVNWFQNFVSLWSETVKAQKRTTGHCCELVSKFCIFVIWNSPVIFVRLSGWLWIGFKILYLCDLKQSIVFSGVSSVCCELVSKFCIFVIWNSYSQTVSTATMLWIGFKILYLCDLKQFSFKFRNVI